MAYGNEATARDVIRPTMPSMAEPLGMEADGKWFPVLSEGRDRLFPQIDSSALLESQKEACRNTIKGQIAALESQKCHLPRHERE